MSISMSYECYILYMNMNASLEAFVFEIFVEILQYLMFTGIER